MSSDSLQSNRPPAPGTSIQRSALLEPWQDDEWQRLWLAIASRPWRTLALIPAGAGASPQFTPLIAVILSRTGMVHLGRPVQVADATQVALSQLTAFFSEIERSTREGERLLIALPPSENAITTAIAQAADVAVLCILNEKMSSSAAKRTVKLIGASRFLGSAIFHPHQFEAASK